MHRENPGQLQQHTDIELVHKIREGDVKSFERVFNQYAESLVRYAETILKNTYEAEDVVQQLFVQFWAKRETVEINTSLKSYLYRATHNSSLNKIKQQGVKENYAAYYTYVGNHVAGSAAQYVEGKEVSEAIGAAIEELPEQCRKVFKMSRFGHLKYQQIADELGISVKTVENQMGKALKHMRVRLKDYIAMVLVYLMNQ